MSRTQEIVERMRSVVAGKEVRSEKARQLAEAVRSLGKYRWTGLYDVGDLMVSLIAYSGPGAPAYATFPVTQGLTGAAIRDSATLLVGHVQRAPRHFTPF